jgi:hypothetical protein
MVIKLGSQQILPIREDKRKIGCDGGKRNKYLINLEQLVIGKPFSKKNQ